MGPDPCGLFLTRKHTQDTKDGQRRTTASEPQKMRKVVQRIGNLAGPSVVEWASVVRRTAPGAPRGWRYSSMTYSGGGVRREGWVVSGYRFQRLATSERKGPDAALIPARPEF